MASVPERHTTPTPTSPDGRSDEFYLYGDPCNEPGQVELLSDYCPGGLHPVVIEDRLGPDGRFFVLHKLGFGGQSTVWLCRDTVQGALRAVKVFRADYSTLDCPDLKAAAHFANVSREELQAHHIVMPLEHFWIEGGNGRHLCTVMPLLGVHVEATRDIDTDKKTCYQMVEAASFLHSRGLCHGDFHIRNILYRVKDIDLTNDEIVDRLGRWSHIPVLRERGSAVEMSEDEGLDEDKRMDEDGDDDVDVDVDVDEDEDVDEDVDEDEYWGERDPRLILSDYGPHVPAYLVMPELLPAEFLTRDIAVVDFGVCYEAADALEYRGTPYIYAAPEILCGGGRRLGYATDMWALAASMYYVIGVGGERWAPTMAGGYPNANVIRKVEMLLGPMPEPYRSWWKEFAPEKLNQNQDQPDADELPIMISKEAWESKLAEERKTIAEHRSRFGQELARQRRWRKSVSRDDDDNDNDDNDNDDNDDARERRISELTVPIFSAKDIDLISDMFGKLDKWFPEDRWSATQLLEHEWFRDLHEEAKAKVWCTSRPPLSTSRCKRGRTEQPKSSRPISISRRTRSRSPRRISRSTYRRASHRIDR